MPCSTINLPGGGVAFVRHSAPRRRRCCACHLAGGYLCDWKVSEGKTCDAPICPEHALEVAPNKHLCPQHREAWAKRQAAKAAP